jgi:ParB-like chromosome segregation protein Spo0J
VFVIHDFDVAGFSIFGTLGTDSRRFRFKNKVVVVDIGLRLDDVESLSLQSEPVQISGDWDARAATLAAHGASPREISFLREKRVELNAMTAPVFVAFLERKLVEHGVSKVVPDIRTVERHARRIIEQLGAEDAMRDVLPEIQKMAESVALPEDLIQRVTDTLRQSSETPWDKAVADIVRGDYEEELLSPAEAP